MKKKKLDSIAPKLVLNGESYESLDEVIERYIIPCNSFIDSVSRHKKFIKGDQETIESALKLEKEKNPNRISSTNNTNKSSVINPTINVVNTKSNVRDLQSLNKDNSNNISNNNYFNTNQASESVPEIDEGEYKKYSILITQTDKNKELKSNQYNSNNSSNVSSKRSNESKNLCELKLSTNTQVQANNIKIGNSYESNLLKLDYKQKSKQDQSKDLYSESKGITKK